VKLAGRTGTARSHRVVGAKMRECKLAALGCSEACLVVLSRSVGLSNLLLKGADASLRGRRHIRLRSGTVLRMQRVISRVWLGALPTAPAAEWSC